MLAKISRYTVIPGHIAQSSIVLISVVVLLPATVDSKPLEDLEIAETQQKMGKYTLANSLSAFLRWNFRASIADLELNNTKSNYKTETVISQNDSVIFSCPRFCLLGVDIHDWSIFECTKLHHTFLHSKIIQSWISTPNIPIQFSAWETGCLRSRPPETQDFVWLHIVNKELLLAQWH